MHVPGTLEALDALDAAEAAAGIVDPPDWPGRPKDCVGEFIPSPAYIERRRALLFDLYEAERLRRYRDRLETPRSTGSVMVRRSRARPALV